VAAVKGRLWICWREDMAALFASSYHILSWLSGGCCRNLQPVMRGVQQPRQRGGVTVKAVGNGGRTAGRRHGSAAARAVIMSMLSSGKEEDIRLERMTLSGSGKRILCEGV
jgi:hypothetical protein